MHGATIKTVTWCLGQMSAVWDSDLQCTEFITVNTWNGGSELCLHASLHLHSKLMNRDIFHTRRDDWLHTSSWSRAPWRIRRITSHNTGFWITLRWDATGWDMMSHTAGVSSFCRQTYFDLTSLRWGLYWDVVDATLLSVGGYNEEGSSYWMILRKWGATGNWNRKR